MTMWASYRYHHRATGTRKSSNFLQKILTLEISENRGTDRRCIFGAEPIASPPYDAVLTYGPVRESRLQ
jgi:hypothetical protein